MFLAAEKAADARSVIQPMVRENLALTSSLVKSEHDEEGQPAHEGRICEWLPLCSPLGRPSTVVASPARPRL
eukprot:1941075-Rhodomonas_salina.1